MRHIIIQLHITNQNTKYYETFFIEKNVNIENYIQFQNALLLCMKFTNSYFVKNKLIQVPSAFFLKYYSDTETWNRVLLSTQYGISLINKKYEVFIIVEAVKSHLYKEEEIIINDGNLSKV